MRPSQDFLGQGGAQNSGDCFISKTDVAVRLGKTPRTIEFWKREGIIPYIKIGKGRRATVLFKWADIEAHLKANFGVGNVAVKIKSSSNSRVIFWAEAKTIFWPLVP